MNDLNLLKDIGKYQNINKSVADATSGAMMRHLWYLSDQLVALALFSPHVSAEEKRRMVVAMESREGEEDPPKRRVGIDMTTIQETQLADFCTTGTMSFETSRIPRGFLQGRHQNGEAILTTCMARDSCGPSQRSTMSPRGVSNWSKTSMPPSLDRRSKSSSSSKWSRSIDEKFRSQGWSS